MALMQIFLIYLFLFLFGCMAGWVVELLFRRFFSAKKWVNPGFMKGPWLPLYGFGVILMFSMCFLCVSFFSTNIPLYNPLGDLFGREGVSGPAWGDLLPILLMWAGMVLLEFLAGLIFIKGFHVKLWDYSNMKGNVMGIICPVFTLIWGAVAVLYYYGINPFLYRISSYMHTYMFGGEGAVAHFGFIFALGIGYGLMIYDFVTSVGLFAAISKYARETGVTAKAEELREKWAKASKEGKTKLFSLLPGFIQDSIIRMQGQPKKESQIKKKIDEAILIDPTLPKDTSANYDENGRPIKTESKEEE